MQERIDAGADEILNGWQTTFKAPFSEANYRDMATMTMQCLADMRNDTSATKQQLLDIMMAQDFQDLTGQVIRKVTDLAHNLEQQLVQLLIDYAPAEVKRESEQRPAQRSADQPREQERRGGRPEPGGRSARQPRLLTGTSNQGQEPGCRVVPAILVLSCVLAYGRSVRMTVDVASNPLRITCSSWGTK